MEIGFISGNQHYTICPNCYACPPFPLTTKCIIYFRYDIRQGDYTKQLDYFDVDSLMLGNGTILTSSTNPSTPAQVNLPLPSTPGSISFSRDIRIDTSQPYVRNMSSSLPSGVYGAGQQIEILVEFNKEVVVSGRPYFLVQTGVTYLFEAIVAAPTSGILGFTHAPIVGQAAAVAITFTSIAPMAAGDEVAIFLDGFTCHNRGLNLSLSGSDAWAFEGTWSSMDSVITLVTLEDLPAGSREVVVDAKNSLEIPGGGTGVLGRYFTIGSKGRRGTIPARAFDSVLGIGVLDSQLNFSPAIAGQPTSLRVFFTLSNGLEANSTVYLRLPGFVGTSKSNLTSHGQQAELFDASWDHELLSLKCKVMTMITSFSLVVDVTNGIALPAAGLVANSPEMTITVDSPSSWGTRFPVPIALTQMVRVFTSSSVSYSPVIINAPVNIHLSFSVEPSGVEPGESIIFNLPAAAMPVNAPSLTLSGIDNQTFTGRYTSQGYISLQPIRSTSPGTVYSVTVDASNQLQLTSTGISGNNLADASTVAIVSQAYPASPAFIIDQQYVGVISLFTLTFSNPQVGKATNFLLNFKISCELSVGDVLSLVLPGFQGSSQIGYLNMSQSAYNFSGFVENGPTKVILRIVSEQLIPSGPVSVMITPDSDITLPPCGIQTDEATLTLSSEAKHCPAFPVSVQASPCVGFCWSSLNYSATNAGARTAIDVSFRLSSGLTPGDCIRVNLPAFTGATVQSLALSGGALSTFNGSWDSLHGRITLECLRYIPSSTTQSIHIAYTNGLSLPSSGLVANDSALTIESNAKGLTGCTPEVVTTCYPTSNPSISLSVDAALRSCKISPAVRVNATGTLCAGVACNVTVSQCPYKATTRLTSPPVFKPVGESILKGASESGGRAPLS